MSVDKEWFKGKIAAAQLTQAKLADICGMSKSAMTMMLNGKRKAQPSEISTICLALHVSEQDVLFRLGVDARSTWGTEGDVPVVGYLDNDLKVHLGVNRGPKTAPRPIGHSGSDLRALRIQTAGSALGALHNGVVYYYETQKVDPDSAGRWCICKIKGNGLVFRGVQRGSTNGSNDLTDMSGRLMETDVVLESAAPMVWMKL